MKSIRASLAALATIVTFASPAFAQDNDWEYEATLYLFMPETRLSAGSIDSKLSFSDALSNLDMAFMGAFGARNGRWGFLADYMMTDLSFGNITSGPAFGGLNTAMKTKIFSAYATYRVHENQTSSVDLAAGFRWFSTDTNLVLLPGASPGASANVGGDWTDPIVGVRANVEFSEKWAGTAFADYGGFQSGRETWQVLLTADYKINDKWKARIGYRTISVNRALNSTNFDFKQSGPIVGASFNF